MENPGYRIEALQLEDVPAAAQLFARSFDNDRQTQMKNLGQREPYDLKKYGLEAMPDFFRSPRCVFLKAVDRETGELMGFCNWGFKGFAGSEMPAVPGRVQPPEPESEPAPPADQGKKEQEEENDKRTKEEPQSVSEDPIDRLQAFTSKDLNDWATEAMNEAPKSMYIIFLAVLPKYQGRGVGSALLRWGTNVCERHGIFARVSSSEPAWRMYQKSGFQVVRTLDVDLDEYAPCPPPGEGPGAKWGHYVFRYMKYLPSRS